jgi:hypothetical protein
VIENSPILDQGFVLEQHIMARWKMGFGSHLSVIGKSMKDMYRALH